MRVSSRSNFFLVLLINLLILIKNVQLNEIIGCGGFIKTHADIDFSKVEVKLLTKQGALKDKTDCSPSNGYYFIPIYDKGEYVLRISPPPGWSFEPEQVKFNFDGVTDVCSLGKDVNFVFKGFGITGKVALGGLGAGANGVDIKLMSEDGKDVRQTKTDVNGIFSFSPIIPGKYIVKASHSKWYFEKSEYTVVVESGNTVLPENSLVVSGFDVNGRFPVSVSGIGIALFKSKDSSAVLSCNRQAIPSNARHSESLYEAAASCYTQVDKSGSYNFKNVAPGKYMLMAVVENKDLKLNIKPGKIEFEVVKDTLELSQEFKISGFSVMGQVLTSSHTGSAIAKAIIKLNGKQVAITDAKGYYSLENIVSAGSYSIQVEAPQLQFNEQKMQLQLTTPVLPPIVPSAYEVCGKVIAKKSYSIGLTKQGSTFHTTVSSRAESGEWCTFLPNGKFTIQVLTTDADKSSGVQFFPVQQIIEVKAEPVKDITFSQLRATLTGSLNCLPDAPAESCSEAEVTILSLDATGQPTGQTQSSKAKNGQYAFKNILPGPYEITIPQSQLCFESTRVFINIASAAESAPDFIHHGYEVHIISSHRAIMKYSHSTAASFDTLKLLTGVNNFCVPKYGSYSIKLEGCHLYDDSLPETFNTASTTPTIINAVAHKVGVRVLSPEATAESLQLQVESDSLPKQIITPQAESHKVDNKFAYRFDTHLKPEEILRITPKSDLLLFEPATKEIAGTNDCVDVAFNFIASRGLILRGKVVPAIKNAKITLSFPKNPEITQHIAMTSLTGEFKFGPINENFEYALNGEKESYVFSDYNRATASFSVHKLCEIIVKVKDEAGQGLSGVLISLSGSESYRKNLITTEDGSINFHSLSPSSYFLRPLLKEFKFEPNSKMIELKDGETVEVEMIGKRVAYSVYGSIHSLNGDPFFSEVNVEAVSNEKCMYHQEEASSENNGKYRIRGLQPSCEYTLRLKNIGKIGDSVDRTIPKERSITVQAKDIQNIDFVAIPPLTYVDVVARITASTNDLYKTLRLNMYRKGAYDSPVYSQPLEKPLIASSRFNPGISVFFPRIPLDGKTYVVELKSTLSDSTYTYTNQAKEFVANTGTIYVELDFTPEVKTYEADMNQNSISALVLVALVAIAFFKQDIAMDFLNFVWSKVSDIIELAQKQKMSAKTSVRKQEPINQKEIEQMAEQINNIKKKKTKKI